MEQQNIGYENSNNNRYTWFNKLFDSPKIREI